MLRILKIILVALVAAFGLAGGFNNVVNWAETLGAVTAVTSMSTWEGGSADWRAVSSTPLTWLGAMWIVVSKIAAALLCGIGAARMWAARRSGAVEFAGAKRMALAGCAVLAIMLFGGFIVVSETWFELWRSEAMRAPVLDAALRYLGSVLLIALFVAGDDPD